MLGDETDGWRRISYTQRGLAPSTTDGPFTVAQHVADAVAVLDALGLEDAVVLGHSWGGFLAAVLAMEHPDRVRGLLLVDPLGIVGDGGYERFEAQLVARTPEDARAKADELDQRAMAGEGTEDDALESLRLVWPAYFNDPATAPPMPDDIRLTVPGYSQTFEDVGACSRPATCRAAPRRTTGRWRSSTAWAARSRSRPRWRPRRRSRTGGRPACRTPATSRGSSSRAASPTGWSGSAPLLCSSSLDVKNLDQPG